MEKLLHERLRDMREGSTVNAWSTADEIERYYIPRPRFEDGEPVKRGDDIDDSSAWFTATYDDGTYHINLCNGKTIEGKEGELVKRPQPKVLDADGVEIKVGDTVWNLENGHEYEVTILPTHDVIPFYTVELLHKLSGMPTAFKPERLTHKEPDSLEKLRDDMSKYLDRGLFDAEKQYSIALNRLSDLIERSA